MRNWKKRIILLESDFYVRVTCELKRNHYLSCNLIIRFLCVFFCRILLKNKGYTFCFSIEQDMEKVIHTLHAQSKAKPTIFKNSPINSRSDQSSTLSGYHSVLTRFIAALHTFPTGKNSNLLYFILFFCIIYFISFW